LAYTPPQTAIRGIRADTNVQNVAPDALADPTPAWARA